MGSSSPSYPGPSTQEKAYWQQMASILEKQQKEYGAMEPYYLKAMNLQPTQVETQQWTEWNKAYPEEQRKAVEDARQKYLTTLKDMPNATQEYEYYKANPEKIPIGALSGMPAEPGRYETQYKEIPYSQREKTAASVLSEHQLLLQGYKTDPMTGTPVAATQDEILAGMTQAEKQQYDINQMAYQREQQALSGTLPIPQAVESKLAEEKRVQEQQLERMLGPNWAMSTPGQNLAAQQETVRGTIRSAVQEGAINTSGALDQINANITAAMSGQTGALQGQFYGAGLQQYGQEMGFPSRQAGLIGEFGNLSGMYQQERINQYTGGLNTAQMGMQRGAATGSAIGGVAGAAIGSYYGAPQGGYMIGSAGGGAIGSYFSAKEMKKNIKRIPEKSEEDVLQEMMGTKHYKFDYKGEPDNSQKYMGMMADEAPREVTTAGRKMMSGQNLLGLHGVAIKALAKKVKRLEGGK